MKQLWETIHDQALHQLSNLESESQSVVVLSTFFDPQDKLQAVPAQSYELTDDAVQLLSEIKRIVSLGGLLFVYGLPHHLAFWGEHLSSNKDEGFQMIFKYWISLGIDDAPRTESLKPTHQGLLMFLKSKAGSRTPTPFHVNTSTVRAPHAYCSACGLNVKDWGGKKHLMNPAGTSLSDVWRDFQKLTIQSHIIPDFVLGRIQALTEHHGATFLHVVQNKLGVQTACLPKLSHFSTQPDSANGDWNTLTFPESNRVYQGDCISFLNKVSEINPEGVFDLAFADPPYNLKKDYSEYDDALADQHYIEWCNQWLEGMARTLKPGGSLIVLNLPKWSIHHAAYLNQRLEFRHWIAWDALSDPRGKIMPAHYALLYYTKPGAEPGFNYSPLGNKPGRDNVAPPDAPIYCLRAGCIKKRKQLNDDKKVELSDVWFDIHRIKHKRDRDAHPCQLPEKLLERIILLTTHKGGVVFDPFCGTGTTALAAKKLDRDFVTIDLDPKYVRIASEKLEIMGRQADLFGVLHVPRKAVKRPKPKASKKEIETYLQKLAGKLGKEPSEQDIAADNPCMLEKIDMLYPSRLAAIKRCRVALQQSAIDYGQVHPTLGISDSTA